MTTTPLPNTTNMTTTPLPNTTNMTTTPLPNTTNMTTTPLPHTTNMTTTPLPHTTNMTTTPLPRIVFMEYFVFQLPLTISGFAARKDSFQQVIATSYAVLMAQIEITNVSAVISPGARRLLANLIEVRLQIGFFTHASSRAPVLLSDINAQLQMQGFPIATIVMLANETITQKTEDHKILGFPALFFWVGCGVILFVIIAVVSIFSVVFCCCYTAEPRTPIQHHLFDPIFAENMNIVASSDYCPCPVYYV